MGVGSQHFSSSAKTGAGVEEIFRILTESNLTIYISYSSYLGIIEYKKTRKEEEPKRKMNTRGALNIGGMTDFNPDANVKLSRVGDQEVSKKKKGKKGCCKG